jgi:streptogrisin D
LRAKHRGVSKKKALIAGAGVIAVAALAVTLPQAYASEENSAPQVMSVKDGTAMLWDEARMPGTAWSVNPETNQIEVLADNTIDSQEWNKLQSTVDSMGGNVAKLERTSGEFQLFAAGGDAIFADGARCSLGFNVTTADGAPAFLTAGHCGVAFDAWSDTDGGAPIATVTDATFPGDGDFSLVTYDDPATEAPSTVNTGDQQVDITGAGEAAEGQQVFRMGSTTGLHDGTVTGLNATVTYPEGTVTGLIQTDVCAEPGDSGGSLFSEDGLAIGLTSGGSGDCTNGGETFFQPVTTALAATGATIGG